LAIGCWLLLVGYWLLAVACWLLAIGYWPLAIGYWLLAIGYWLLAIGCWLLPVGYWLLAIGYCYWLLAIGGHGVFNNPLTEHIQAVVGSAITPARIVCLYLSAAVASVHFQPRPALSSYMLNFLLNCLFETVATPAKWVSGQFESL
jgi:hypothetical protein